MSPTSRSLARLTTAAVAALAATLPAGSSSAGGGARTTASTPPAVASSSSSVSSAPPPASTPPARPAAHAAGANLTGTWSGNYGGAFQGSFSLHWTQSGARLSGSITLSNPGETLSLNGTVNGSAIAFGTVGSAAITYSGTVSGSSMSGSYRVAGAAGGNWDAHHSA